MYKVYIEPVKIGGSPSAQPLLPPPLLFAVIDAVAVYGNSLGLGFL